MFKQPKSEKISDKRPWIENGEGFAVHNQPHRVARKASDVSAADWRCKTREKISYFFTCVVTSFLRAGNPCITPL